MTLSIVDALRDPQMFGALPQFADATTWRAWVTFLKAFEGAPLDEDELALFQRCTRRDAPRPGGYPEAAVIVGRQAGKSQIAAVLGAFVAATQGGRGLHVPLVAQDFRGAQRALLSYAREALSVPVLSGELVRETADSLELQNGTTLAVYPSRPAALRGIRAPFVLLDELAFMISSDGRPNDREMLRAVRPTLATTGGKLLILSSPWGQSGALWDLHRKNFAVDSPILIWQSDAPTMNPRLPADYLERMREDDPEAYRSEVLGEFRAGLSSLLDPDSLDRCVARGVREVPPEAGIRYFAHLDPSSGRGDAAALAIGHRDGETVRLDLVRTWRPPFDPETTIAQAAAECRRYGVHRVQTDRYALGFVISGFARHGITADVAPKVTSEHHLGLVPLVNASRLVLLDNPDLLRELRGLERRAVSGGRDRVDHRPGSHDDLAAAVSGMAALAGKPCGASFDFGEVSSETPVNPDQPYGPEHNAFGENLDYLNDPSRWS